MSKTLFLLVATFALFQINNTNAKSLKLSHFQPQIAIKNLLNKDPKDLIDDGNAFFDEFEKSAQSNVDLALKSLKGSEKAFIEFIQSEGIESVVILEENGRNYIKQLEEIKKEADEANIDITECYNENHEKLINLLIGAYTDFVDCFIERAANSLIDIHESEAIVEKIYNVIVNLRKAFNRCRNDDCRYQILNEVERQLRTFLPMMIDTEATLQSLKLTHDSRLLQVCTTKTGITVQSARKIIDDVQGCLEA